MRGPNPKARGHLNWALGRAVSPKVGWDGKRFEAPVCKEGIGPPRSYGQPTPVFKEVIRGKSLPGKEMGATPW